MEFDRGLLRHIGLASTAVGAFLCVASPALADGNMFGQVTNFFTAPFGGNKANQDDNGDVIDYRPRPVLVVPPSNDLPPPHAVVTRTANWPKDPDGAALRRAKADSRRPAPSSDSKLDPSQVDALADTPAKPSDRTESCSNVRGTPVCISMPSFNGIPGVENLFGADKSNTEIHLSSNPHRKYLSDPPVTYLAPVQVTRDGDGDGRVTAGAVTTGGAAAAPGQPGAQSQCMFPGWFGCPERQPVVRISQSGDASSGPAPAQGAPAQGAPVSAAQPGAKKCMFPGWFGCPEQ
ncbi:MAG: hypothetical protein ACLP8A_02615 [Methylovirgula sp.]